MTKIPFYLGMMAIEPCIAGEPRVIALEDSSGKILIRSANVVSPDGLFVAGTASMEGQTGTFAYRWSRDGVHLIGDLPGGEVMAYPTGMSKDGRMVVGYSSSEAGTQAFGWTEKSGMIGLGDLLGGEFKSQARGVSADGKVIVGYGTAEGGSSDRRQGDAFIWTPQRRTQVLPGIEPFRDTMWAEDVSADGSTVVGKGSNSNGQSEAFLWKQGQATGSKFGGERCGPFDQCGSNQRRRPIYRRKWYGAGRRGMEVRRIPYRSWRIDPTPARSLSTLRRS